jgi:hypothetical protein
MLISFMGKRQGSTGLSTAEVETVAHKDGMFGSAIPLAAILDFLVMREVRIIGEQDNMASIQAITKGYSRKLSHLVKTQRTSIAALHEQYFGDESLVECVEDDNISIHRLRHISGERNTADIMTKPMDVSRHWYLMKKMGMSMLEALQ